MRKGLAVLLVVLILGLTGCFKADQGYTIPTDIYNVTLNKGPFEYKARKFQDTKIGAGRELTASDFQLKVNDELILQLGEKVDTSKLEFVKEYNYDANGTIREYKEPTGNYKVLVAPKEDGSYLMAALTISKYVPTFRGIHNGMRVADLDILMSGIIFQGDLEDDQESRAYSFDNMTLIVTMKYDIVRSIQIILSNY